MAKMATCHPDRLAKCRGLCRHCYGRQYEYAMSDTPCVCGCGLNVRRGRTYLQGHYAKSEQGRAAIIARQTGKTLSAETRAKMGAAHKGRKPTVKMMARLAEWNKSGWQKTVGYKISAALRGRKLSPDHIAKLGVANRGRKHSPESIEKMRRSQNERYKIAEERLKHKYPLLGRKFSPETLAKMSASQKRRVIEKPETFANARAAARRNPGPSRATVEKMRAANIGRKHTLEARASMSMGQRARAARTKPWEWGGWKGGASNIPYPTSWDTAKRDVRKRDGHACMMCGRTDFTHLALHVPDVHHIDGNKQNCDHKNLISLCRRDHKFSQDNMDDSIFGLHSILTERYGYVYP